MAEVTVHGHPIVIAEAGSSTLWCCVHAAVLEDEPGARITILEATLNERIRAGMTLHETLVAVNLVFREGPVCCLLGDERVRATLQPSR